MIYLCVCICAEGGIDIVYHIEMIEKHTNPHHTTPHHTAPHYTIPYNSKPFHNITYNTMLHLTIPYYTMHFHAMPCHTNTLYYAYPTTPCHIYTRDRSRSYMLHGKYTCIY